MVTATSYFHLMEAASTLKSVKRGASPGMERHSEDSGDLPGLGRQLGAAELPLNHSNDSMKAPTLLVVYEVGVGGGDDEAAVAGLHVAPAPGHHHAPPGPLHAGPHAAHLQGEESSLVISCPQLSI